jgi:hypothetical protein
MVVALGSLGSWSKGGTSTLSVTREHLVLFFPARIAASPTSILKPRASSSVCVSLLFWKKKCVAGRRGSRVSSPQFSMGCASLQLGERTPRLICDVELVVLLCKVFVGIVEICEAGAHSKYPTHRTLSATQLEDKSQMLFSDLTLHVVSSLVPIS